MIVYFIAIDSIRMVWNSLSVMFRVPLSFSTIAMPVLFLTDKLTRRADPQTLAEASGAVVRVEPSSASPRATSSGCPSCSSLCHGRPAIKKERPFRMQLRAAGGFIQFISFAEESILQKSSGQSQQLESNMTFNKIDSGCLSFIPGRKVAVGSLSR